MSKILGLWELVVKLLVWNFLDCNCGLYLFCVKFCRIEFMDMDVCVEVWRLRYFFRILIDCCDMVKWVCVEIGGGFL